MIVSLLKELKGFSGSYYKHLAPNGAITRHRYARLRRAKPWLLVSAS
jgi:hypothetical protein